MPRGTHLSQVDRALINSLCNIRTNITDIEIWQLIYVHLSHTMVWHIPYFSKDMMI